MVGEIQLKRAIRKGNPSGKCLLKKGILLMPFSLNQLPAFLKPLKSQSLKKGQYLFRQGEATTHIFIVKKGRIKLVRETFEGFSVVLHIAREGEGFAEASLFSSEYHCNCLSDLPSQVICLPKGEVLEALGKNKELAEGFMAHLARQVQYLRSNLELRNIRSARQRIFQYLLLKAGEVNSEIHLTSSFKDAAYHIGLAHETFYRELAKLEKEGFILRDGTKIKILKPPKI